MTRIGKAWWMMIAGAMSLLAWMGATLPGRPVALESICRSRDASTDSRPRPAMDSSSQPAPRGSR